MHPPPFSLLLLLLLLLPCSFSLKILVYNPLFAVSHVRTMNKIAETLVDYGHDVVELMPATNKLVLPPKGDKTRRILVDTVPNSQSISIDEFFEQIAHDSWRQDFSPWNLLDWDGELRMHSEQCNFTLTRPGLMDRLREEKFDFAISEAFDLCGFAIFHHLGIEKYATAMTTGMVEFIDDVIGVPSALSHVPGLLSFSSSSMTFYQRVENVISKWLYEYLYWREKPYFEQVIHNVIPNCPDIKDLISRSSLVFTNDDPLLDFPRPTLFKVVPIGGISVPANTGAKLDEEWDSLLSLRPQTVFISFGTICLSRLMPDEYKAALLETFTRFPNVTFIWKYERPEENPAKGIDNVVVKKWVPQPALLGDPRLSAFITHGGMGSTQEAVLRGVPIVVVPIFADQFRNAKMMERAGSAVFLEKKEMAYADKIETSIRSILEDDRFKERARHLSSMIASRPFTVKDLLVRNVEFAATYGPLDMMDPKEARQLNYIQYHLLDVYALCGTVFLGSLLVVYKTARILFYFVQTSTSFSKAKLQ